MITYMFWEGEKRRALGPTDNIHKMTTVVLPRARALPLCCSRVLVSTNPPLTDCDTYAASDSDPHPKAQDYTLLRSILKKRYQRAKMLFHAIQTHFVSNIS